MPPKRGRGEEEEGEGEGPSIQRNYSTSTAPVDQYNDLLMREDNEADAIATVYDRLDSELNELIQRDLRTRPIDDGRCKIRPNNNQPHRIIIHLENTRFRPPREYFHFSLFTKNRYGGLHLTCPDGSPSGIKIYVENQAILDCCGKDRSYLISNLIETLLYYFKNQRRRDGSDLQPFVKRFIDSCLRKGYDTREALSDIKYLLNEFKYRFERHIQWACMRDCHLRPGGSNKLVNYSGKIQKLRELNKKLRKNKTKNKTKIQKNNKKIDELKIKIKKEKEKAKAKLKKEKAKAKLKKEKAKAKAKLKKEKEKAKAKAKLKKEKAKAKEKLKKEKAKVKKVHITKKIKK